MERVVAAPQNRTKAVHVGNRLVGQNTRVRNGIRIVKVTSRSRNLSVHPTPRTGNRVAGVVSDRAVEYLVAVQ